MSTKRRKATTPSSEPSAPEPVDLPERWSAQRKTELVQRGAFLSLFTHLPPLRQAFQQVVQQRLEELRALATRRG